MPTIDDLLLYPIIKALIDDDDSENVDAGEWLSVMESIPSIVKDHTQSLYVIANAEVLAVMRPYTAASNKARKPAMVMSTSPPNRVRVRMGDGTRRSLRLNIRQAPSGPATHDLRGHDRNLKRAWEGWWRLLHNSAWCKRIDGRRGLIDRSYRHTQ